MPGIRCPGTCAPFEGPGKEHSKDDNDKPQLKANERTKQSVPRPQAVDAGSKTKTRVVNSSKANSKTPLDQAQLSLTSKRPTTSASDGCPKKFISLLGDTQEENNE